LTGATVFFGGAAFFAAALATVAVDAAAAFLPAGAVFLAGGMMISFEGLGRNKLLALVRVGQCMFESRHGCAQSS
jgi:hypothetical protein